LDQTKSAGGPQPQLIHGRFALTGSLARALWDQTAGIGRPQPQLICGRFAVTGRLVRTMD
jgi:hypothetical protein